MAFRFKKNLLSTGTDGTIIYEFKEFMKSASPNGPGWTVKLSSNGTTFGAGDNITSKSVLTTTNTWFVLRDPANKRELMFQHTGSGYLYLIRYSASVGFSGGSATVAPTATDQKIILSNSGGTGGSAFLPIITTNTVVTQFGADDSDGYSFFMGEYYLDHGLSSGSYGCLFMDDLVAGSYSEVNDLDPVVFSILSFNTGNICNVTESNTTARCIAWFNKGTVSEGFGICPGRTYGNANYTNNRIPGRSPQNIANKSTYLLPIPYMKLNYFKGLGKNFKWNPLSIGGSTYDKISSGCRFYDKSSSQDVLLLGDVAFPWDGSNVL